MYVPSLSFRVVVISDYKGVSLCCLLWRFCWWAGPEVKYNVWPQRTAGTALKLACVVLLLSTRQDLLWSDADHYWGYLQNETYQVSGYSFFWVTCWVGQVGWGNCAGESRGSAYSVKQVSGECVWWLSQLSRYLGWGVGKEMVSTRSFLGVVAQRSMGSPAHVLRLWNIFSFLYTLGDFQTVVSMLTITGLFVCCVFKGRPQSPISL